MHGLTLLEPPGLIFTRRLTPEGDGGTRVWIAVVREVDVDRFGLARNKDPKGTR